MPHDRIMPHDVFTEGGIVGSILFLADIKAYQEASFLQPEMFYSRTHREIWKAIVACAEANEPPDTLHVYNHLDHTKGNVQEIVSVIHKEVKNNYSLSNIESLAHRVRDLFFRRQAINKATGAIEASYSQLPIEDIRAMMDMEPPVDNNDDQWENMATVADETLAEIDARRLRKNTLDGVTTGLVWLDGLFDGLKPGQLVIVAARPSVGKTAIAVFMALAAARESVCVGFVSLEMRRNDMFKRLISTGCKINLSEVSRMDTSVMDWSGITKDGYYLPIFFADNAFRMDQIERSIRFIHEKHNAGIVFVDYLQLIEPAQKSRNADSREREIAQVSRTLKTIAMQLGIPIIALSQLNRGASDREPRISDLRESGALEQDADIVILLDRPFLRGVGHIINSRGEKISMVKMLEMNVAKHRNGPIDHFYFEYRPDINALWEWDETFHIVVG